MPDERDKLKRLRARQYSLGLLLAVTTTAAVVIAWRMLAASVIAGVLVSLVSPTAVVISGLLLLIVAGLVGLRHHKHEPPDRYNGTRLPPK